MITGSLTEIITIQRPVVKETAYSADETEYEDYLTTRAAVTHLAGRRGMVANEITNTYSVRFVIRYYHKIEYGMIIRHKGVRYSIQDINPERNKQSITITAEVINE